MQDEINQKLAILNKLNNLQNQGIHLSKNYNMTSSIDEMTYEYSLMQFKKEKLTQQTELKNMQDLLKKEKLTQQKELKNIRDLLIIGMSMMKDKALSEDNKNPIKDDDIIINIDI